MNIERLPDSLIPTLARIEYHVAMYPRFGTLGTIGRVALEAYYFKFKSGSDLSVDDKVA